MQSIESKGLCAGSLFKLLATGLFFPLFIVGVLCGIAALFGSDTVSLNNEYVHGMKGLVVGTLIGLILPVVMGAVLTVFMAPSIWLWTRFKSIKINIKD